MSLNSNAALNEMVVDLNALAGSGIATEYANWDYIDGNSTEYTWIDGTLGRVVSKIEYLTGATVELVRTFTYNASDEVTSIVAAKV